MSKDLDKECHSTVLYDNMNISHRMVHAQQVDLAEPKELGGEEFMLL